MADLVYVDGKPVAEEGDEEDYCSHKDDGGNDEVECKSFRHFLLLFKCFRSVPKVEVGFWVISTIDEGVGRGHRSNGKKKKESDFHLPAFLLKSMRSLSRCSYTEATSSKLKFSVLVIVSG